MTLEWFASTAFDTAAKSIAEEQKATKRECKQYEESIGYKDAPKSFFLVDFSTPQTAPVRLLKQRQVMMSAQQPPFVYTLLEWKLRERLDVALSLISRLPKEDVLECGSGCLTELVREFAVAPPILRLDLRVADEEFAEAVDMTFDRKTGDTCHIFLIPVEREAEWLEEIAAQRTPIDDVPLAFLDKFESEAEAVELVFVLLTPDDEVAKHHEADPQKRRARQNVILELGFFLGKLGRKSGKILLLHKGPVEIPSDIIGIEYLDITNGIESAGETIRREMEALGILR